MSSLIESLPHLAKLHAQLRGLPSPTNFFTQFEDRLKGNLGATYAHYRQIDQWLACIPAGEWDSYCSKLRECVCLYDPDAFWRKFHDTLHEALGAWILTRDYRCGGLRYEPSKKAGKTPDWRGMSDDDVYYIEVKTVNYSDRELRSWPTKVRSEVTPLDPNLTALSSPLAAKIADTYGKARSQLAAPEDAFRAKKIAAFVIFNDRNVDPLEVSLADLYSRHFASIEVPEYPILFVVAD